VEKREVLKILAKTKYISPFSQIHGRLDGDEQVPNTFLIYGDVAMDLVLVKLLPIIEKKLTLKLVPTVSYTRIYKKGDVLKKHTDRDACAVSGTMHLGGDLWSIYLKESSKKVHKVLLNPGDILLYDGCKFEHWREEFGGELCTQLFLHYNKKGSKNIYDGRARLGLPSDIHKS
tara:strand:+ start:1346 stop:1867 length:522 start_codon:yes stop_codon:yes gene_type:complete